MLVSTSPYGFVLVMGPHFGDDLPKLGVQQALYLSHHHFCRGVSCPFTYLAIVQLPHRKCEKALSLYIG